MRWRPRWSVRARLTLWYTAVLLVLLLVTTGLSYALLDRALVQEVDNSLLTVAKVIRDVRSEPGEVLPATPSEVMLQTVLGPELTDKVFQLSDSSGQPAVRSSRLHGTVLPLSPRARAAAARGRQTFETVVLEQGGTARLLTLPVTRDKRLAQIIQVGLSLARAEHTLGRYLDTLVLLVPVALLLSVAGGAAIARVALRPVDEMSRAARRISAEDLGRRLALRGTRDELDHLAGTLNGMLDRLEDTFRQIKRFSADAAHELRTPLTALKGGIEVALRTPRSAETYRDVLASSLEEVDRLIRLAEDLLVLARLGRRIPLARERVELEALVLEVADVGAQLGLQAGVTVTVKEAVSVAVLGETTALRRAALNLVDNAVRYTPAGGAVEVGLSASDEEAVITVRDTGIGLSREEADAVFDPFVRGEGAAARNPGGTGLGLAITRSVALVHGGAVTLDTAPGRGSTFALRLPRGDAAA